MKILVFSFKNLVELMETIPSDNHARVFLEQMRWGGVPVCPHCGVKNANHYHLKKKGIATGLYKCKDCRERFTVTVGTMFEGSHIGLRKWFIAIYLFSAHKKGISSIQLAKDLGITQKSAWYMLSLIRMSFAPEEKKQHEGIVMIDETFVGGKNENKHKDKQVEGTQGRSTKSKSAVVGVMSDGKVNTTIVKDTKAVTLKPIIKEMVKGGSILVTDQHDGYLHTKKDYDHKVINHKQGRYAVDGFSTNALEGFWSLLKRGVYGVYHQVSRKHLGKYCDEFSYRYNTRKMTDSERFRFSIYNATSRISYKDLTFNPSVLGLG